MTDYKGYIDTLRDIEATLYQQYSAYLKVKAMREQLELRQENGL